MKIAYRPDVDGLRAVGIVLVVMYHGFPRFLKGGFIGVDVFFVISGFIITSIIYKEILVGNFSILDFYLRRARRIFPALILVLITCLITGFYILLPEEYALLGKHVFSGALYFQNITLQSEAGYFDSSSELKPLLHLWSLSIEEQFYFAYPLILIFACKHIKINIIFLICSIALCSLAANVYYMTYNSTFGFFMPQTRAWELLVGCTTFFIRKNVNIAQQNLTSSIGIALILFCWFFFDKSKILYPGVWALIPAVGTSFIILSSESWINKIILSSRPMVAIGLISYPLYLWHWPLLAFLRITEMENPADNLIFSGIALSITLSYLTYIFIERPARKIESKIKICSIISLTILIGLFGGFVYQNHGLLSDSIFIPKKVKGEVGNKSWTEFLTTSDCISRFGAYDYCLIKDPKSQPTTILIGDSHSNHLYPGLINTPYFREQNVINLGVSWCPPIYDIPSPKCNQLINSALDYAINTDSISTIILSHRNILDFKRLRKPSLSKSLFNLVHEDDIKNTILDNFEKTLNKLVATKKKIIYILDIPRPNFNPGVCLDRPWKIGGQGVKSDCSILLKNFIDERNEFLSLINPTLIKYPDIQVWDPIGALCDNTHCSIIKNGTILYRDDNHLNRQGSNLVMDYLTNNYK